MIELPESFCYLFKKDSSTINESTGCGKSHTTILSDELVSSQFSIYSLPSITKYTLAQEFGLAPDLLFEHSIGQFISTRQQLICIPESTYLLMRICVARDYKLTTLSLSLIYSR
ncbi:hypothetical protein EVAR_70447_1 [Eumeta japonica]|uniref:Uncharacterized protein n=1 Tax=Eumeta variegata TaxID=151549 RepID=A0A4C2AEH9_EUMVA|nr:hypothetical protein EVAR_70447_1 [Eumeta japonica]